MTETEQSGSRTSEDGLRSKGCVELFHMVTIGLAGAEQTRAFAALDELKSRHEELREAARDALVSFPDTKWAEHYESLTTVSGRSAAELRRFPYDENRRRNQSVPDAQPPPIQMCLISTTAEPVICDGGCGMAACPRSPATERTAASTADNYCPLCDQFKDLCESQPSVLPVQEGE
jgi:hypothetical protein